jgi:hypothetical protein
MSSLGYQLKAGMSETDYAKAVAPVYGRSKAFGDEYSDYADAYTISTLGTQLNIIRLEWEIKIGFGSLRPDEPETWGQKIIDEVKRARQRLDSPPPPAK